MFSFLNFKHPRRATKSHSEPPLLLTSVSSKAADGSEKVSHKYTELYDYFSELYQMHAEKDEMISPHLEDMYTSIIDKLKKNFTIKDLFDDNQDNSQNQKIAAKFLVVAYLNRGLARIIQGKHHEAIRDFTTLLELDPMQAEARYQRSIIYSLNSKHRRDLNRDIKILATTTPYSCNFYRIPIQYSFYWTNSKPTSSELVVIKCNRYIQTPEGLFFFNKNTRNLITIPLITADQELLYEVFDDNEENIEQLSAAQLRLIQQITKYDPPQPVEYEILYTNSYILNGTTLKYISTYGQTVVVHLRDVNLFLEQIDELFSNTHGNQIMLSRSDIECIITANSGHYPDVQRILSDDHVLSFRQESFQLESTRLFSESNPKTKPAPCDDANQPGNVVPHCESVFYAASTEEPSLSSLRPMLNYELVSVNSMDPDADYSDEVTISRVKNK